MIVNEGKIIDASFIEVLRQRNNREEHQQIKDGKIPVRFEYNSHVKSHKVVDARWTKKNNVSCYGYKNHIKGDSVSKFITGYYVTAASVHDSQTTDILLDDNDQGQPLYADSAYSGEPREQIISGKKMINQVCEKGTRNNPLTEEQKESNREESRIRSRVEHIFGYMENSMNQMYIQCIAIKRATSIICLMNLTYNMCRKIQLMSV